MENIKIACPKCSWQPDGGAHWQCSCGCSWDTFSTGGRCPECKFVWEDTQCPPYPGGCMAWSKHEDWYKGIDDAVSALMEELKHQKSLI